MQSPIRQLGTQLEVAQKALEPPTACVARDSALCNKDARQVCDASALEHRGRQMACMQRVSVAIGWRLTQLCRSPAPAWSRLPFEYEIG